MPIYNGIEITKVAIDSILNSTNVPFELLLVESESNDGTAELCDKYAETYKKIKVFHIPKNGLVAAINYGIKEAGENDVYITQNDTVHFKLYKRDWLYEMFMTAHEDENIGMVTSLFGNGVSGEDYLKGLNWIGTWSCYIPRRTIDKVGLFDENMGPGDDIDFSYRCIKAGLKFAMVPFWVQHHRLTDHEDADSQAKQKRMGDYFKKKWNLK
jgi:GT2 family glycosyltransferase